MADLCMTRDRYSHTTKKIIFASCPSDSRLSGCGLRTYSQVDTSYLSTTKSILCCSETLQIEICRLVTKFKVHIQFCHMACIKRSDYLHLEYTEVLFSRLNRLNQASYNTWYMWWIGQQERRISDICYTDSTSCSATLHAPTERQTHVLKDV